MEEKISRVDKSSDLEVKETSEKEISYQLREVINKKRRDATNSLADLLIKNINSEPKVSRQIPFLKK